MEILRKSLETGTKPDTSSLLIVYANFWKKQGKIRKITSFLNKNIYLHYYCILWRFPGHFHNHFAESGRNFPERLVFSRARRYGKQNDHPGRPYG